MIRVLLVDDQQLVRAGLRMLCESAADLDVVAEADSGNEAIRLAERLRPDVVLMDLHMPRVDGIAATRRILAVAPAIRILVLTTFDDDDHLYRALAAGACGFLVKDAAPSELLDGIRRAAAGDSPFSPPVLRRLVSQAVAAHGDGWDRPTGTANGAGRLNPAGTTAGTPGNAGANGNCGSLVVEQPTLDSLTAREREVLVLLGTGRSNAEIAARLNVGVTTVKTHISNLITKTGTPNRIGLAVFAVRTGLVPDSGQ